MSAILLLLTRLASVAQTALAVFSFFKKAGADEKENEILKEKAKKNEKDIEELAKSNEFMSRISRDPAYRDRMRRLLDDAANGKAPAGKEE